MSETKKPVENAPSKKSEVAVTKKKATAIHKSPQKSSAAITPYTTSDLLQAFDDTFERFRSDFEDLLFPQTWASTLPLMPETRVPTIDLEDREKDFLLKAEMPGFKKENIEIEVQGNAVAIYGETGWKYDKKEHEYICKERACKTFYRVVDLPEEIKDDQVTANLIDGVLEVTLPKKVQRKKRKVKVA
jgi:HSP20 family protein